MSLPLARSYAYCEQVARKEAGNFYHAFRVLPRAERLAMCALYAFLRYTDDLADGPSIVETKRAQLGDWRRQLEEALHGTYGHALHPAFHDAVRRYAIPHQYFSDVLDGVEMDLDHEGYATFPELYRYCYRVASAVGLACIHVWGCTEPRANAYAESAGIGFQLTNILRDLGEDAGRGRVYLPTEDLERFGYDGARLGRGERDARFRDLMRFEVERARSYYRAAEPLGPLLPRPGRAVFQVMVRTYEGLLDAIEGRDYDVFSGRVRLSAWRKLGLVAEAIPVRLGWSRA